MHGSGFGQILATDANEGRSAPLEFRGLRGGSGQDQTAASNATKPVREEGKRKSAARLRGDRREARPGHAGGE